MSRLRLITFLHALSVDACNLNVLLVYFQDQLYDQPWCSQGQRSSPMEVECAQVGARLPNAPIAMLTLSEGNIPLHENVAYGGINT